MAIKVLIKRNFKADRLSQASKLLNRARYSAMDLNGYISSETLTDLQNPNRIVVASMWHHLADWEQWKQDPLRKEIVVEMEKIMNEPEVVEIYEMGMQTSL